MDAGRYRVTPGKLRVPTKYRAIPGDGGRYRRILCDNGRYPEITAGAGRYREISVDARRYREIPGDIGRYRNITAEEPGSARRAFLALLRSLFPSPPQTRLLRSSCCSAPHTYMWIFLLRCISVMSLSGSPARSMPFSIGDGCLETMKIEARHENNDDE